MYNILLALLIATLTYLLVAVTFSPWAAILPALALMIGLAWYLTWRTNRKVQAQLAPLESLLQSNRIDDARALLQTIRAAYGKWQFQLEGQIDGQLAMFDYMQMRFDKARPLLEASASVSWMSALALGCLAWRSNDLDKAYEHFQAAAKVDKKEVVVYAIPAVALAKKGRTRDALETLRTGLDVLESQPLLKQLQLSISNRKAINTDDLPDAWRMFFPEEVAKDAVMRGRRGPDRHAAQREALERSARKRGRAARR